MTVSLLASLLLASPGGLAASVVGHDVGVRAVEEGDTVHLEFLTVDARGRSTVVATEAATGLDFNRAVSNDDGLTLYGDTFICHVSVPEFGNVFEVVVRGSAPTSSLPSAIFGVALSPYGRATKPSDWFAPPWANPTAVTTERLGTPVVLAKGGGYGAALMPDLDDLNVNRPMAPVLGVDTTGRVSVSAILYYGFAAYDRNADGTARPFDGVLANPSAFSWKFDLLIADEIETVSLAEHHLWSRYGERRSMRLLPQTVPFRYYTKPTFDMEREGGEPLWWEAKSGSEKLLAPKSADGKIRLTADENVLRFAWALRWWGGRLKQFSWEQNADAVMNLVSKARDPRGRTTVAFDTERGGWDYEEFNPSAAAQTARWKLKYATDFPDYVGSARLLSQVRATAGLLSGAPLTGLTAAFLHEFASSSAIKDERAKQSAQGVLSRNVRALTEKTLRKSRDDRTPTADTVAGTLVVARLGDTTNARALLERFFLSQAVSQPATVVGAEIFGAFAGPHFLAESQSAYTGDLVEAAMLVGDPRLVRRAVAALRAPLGLFFHATHSISGMRLPDKIPFFRSSPWFGMGAESEFGDWRGVADGIGQSLASIGQCLDRYGSVYTGRGGWTVAIDGLRMSHDGTIYTGFGANPLTFDGSFPFEHLDARTGARTSGDDPAALPAMREITLAFENGTATVLALPGFTVSDSRKLSARFLFGDGTSVEAQLLSTGFGAKVDATQLRSGGVLFNGAYDGSTLTVGPAYYSIGPPAADASWPLGWRRVSLLSDTARPSIIELGQTILSTADNGLSGRSMQLTGRIESQKFVLDQNGITFTMLGKADPDTYIELVDAQLSVPIFTSRKSTDGPEPVTWELFTRVGSLVYVRIVDHSKTGALEISSLKSADVSPGG